MSKIKFLIFVVIISTIGQMAAEIYIPSLPYIGKDFNVSHSLIQLSMSGFLCGMAIPGIFFGYASDYVGRRKILLISTIISLIGSVLCLIAPNIYCLIAGRIIQGIGFSGIGSLGRATLRDRFSGQELAKYLSYLGIAISLAIDIAPFLGGILQQFFGWRIVFALILVYNLYAMYLCYNYKGNETLIRTPMQFSNLLSTCVILFKDNTFMRYNIISAFNYAVFMAFLAITSFILQDRLGLSPAEFGVLTLLLTTVYMAGCFVNGHLINKMTMDNLLLIGIGIIIAAGVMFVILDLINYLTMTTYLIAVCGLYFGSGFVFANSSAQAFMHIDTNIGTASALFSSVQIALGAIITAFISLFNPEKTLAIGLIISILTILSLIVLKMKQKGLEI